MILSDPLMLFVAHSLVYYHVILFYLLDGKAASSKRSAHGISMGIAYMGDKQELVVNNTADSSNMTRRNRAHISAGT